MRILKKLKVEIECLLEDEIVFNTFVISLFFLIIFSYFAFFYYVMVSGGVPIGPG